MLNLVTPQLPMSHSIFALFYLHKRIGECKSHTKLVMPIIFDSTNILYLKVIDIVKKTKRKVVSLLTTECSTKGKTDWLPVFQFQADAGRFQLIFIWEKAKTVINYRFFAVPRAASSSTWRQKCNAVTSFTVENCFRNELMMSSRRSQRFLRTASEIKRQ